MPRCRKYESDIELSSVVKESLAFELVREEVRLLGDCGGRDPVVECFPPPHSVVGEQKSWLMDVDG